MGRSIPKPRYTEGLLRTVFLCLGAAFAAAALFTFFGLLKPHSNSAVQDKDVLTAVFIAVSAAFCVAQAVLGAVVSAKEKRRGRLLADGLEIAGRVERVYLQRGLRWGGVSPYRIVYSFPFRGKTLRRTSRLLWEEPACKAGERIAVFADGRGRSAVGDC